MFSSRLPVGLPSNAITQALSTLRTAGAPVLDLTETNPTLVGLAYPSAIAGALADPGVLTYAPEPLGLPSAREAASRECGRSGATVDADRIVLTTSTSEAYTLLFKLLCDPGDSVLVPQPSYPLFESLAGLDGVRADPYRLEYHGRWSIDRDSVRGALSSSTRAILVVTPNNPTGSMLRAADRDWLAALAAERDIAIISDEVFSEFLFGERRPAPVPEIVDQGQAEKPSQLDDRIGVIVNAKIDRAVGEPSVATLGTYDDERGRLPAATVAPRGIARDDGVVQALGEGLRR